MDAWKFLAGLGLFMYGMGMLERVLKNLSGRSFKLFLKKYTQRLPTAIIGGALITGLVQSSSIVSLLVLAFVEAGTVTFRNALGVILGSNVGTTITSWIVATVGFKFDVESYSLPVVGISSIAMFFTQEHTRLHNLFRLFFSLSILFLGLGFMKAAAEQLVATVDLMAYSQYGTLMYVLVGFLITVVVQSSSATVAMTLTALYTNAISFEMAAAVVIGSELGTTIKIVMAGLSGTADKKRVAWGNFIFNLVTGIVVYAALPWIIIFIQDGMDIKDPLLGLVFLQTTINVLSIVLFFPIIDLFANWLGKRFKTDEVVTTSFINSSVPVVPEVAIDSLFKESKDLLQKTINFLAMLLHLEPKNSHNGFLGSFRPSGESVNTAYDGLKKTEGSILNFYTKIQTNELSTEHYTLLNQYISAVRYCIRAAKTLKDIQHDIKEFESSADDTIHRLYIEMQTEWKEFNATFLQLMEVIDSRRLFEELALGMKRAFEHQRHDNSEIINALREKYLDEMQTSTMMNVHHEILSSKKSLLRALAHLKLTSSQADEFEFLPES